MSLSALCAHGRLAPLLRATYPYPLRKHQPETALAGRVAAWHDPWGPFRFTGYIFLEAGPRPNPSTREFLKLSSKLRHYSARQP